MVRTNQIRLIPRQQEQVSLEKDQDVSDRGVQAVIPNLLCQFADSCGRMSELDFKPIINITCLRNRPKSTSLAPARAQLTTIFGKRPNVPSVMLLRR